VPLTIAENPIKSLQTQTPRGSPLDISTLSKLGISSALAHYYLTSGWLQRLGRGVFALSNDTLELNACVRFLADRIPGLHVGGKTALAWRGTLHNLSQRESIWLFGDLSTSLPRWFQDRFAAMYLKRKLFSNRLPHYFGLSSLPERPDGPLVSEPERALLEMLGEVGLRVGVEEARNIMEGLGSPRPETLEVLLKHCTRIKVVRLCVTWAKELNLPWADEAGEAMPRKVKRNRSRWTSRLKDGTTLILKP
jgi:Transcriptional regulator, AbiEi antitoxin, Type IV TA system/Transcriptional regulator, AbiEi antitoxin N-terminal domain